MDREEAEAARDCISFKTYILQFEPFLHAQLKRCTQCMYSTFHCWNISLVGHEREAPTEKLPWIYGASIE